LHTQTSQQAGLLNITYYTDPLCCWSWAFEPERQKLIREFKNTVAWRICMGGLLPGWKNYHDAVNSISKPLQMGPMWMHAAQLTGADIQHDIWAKDPPASSYPACIAVKTAQLQSARAGEKYFRLLQTACMAQGRNIAKLPVLLDVATLLSQDKTLEFDVEIFKNDITGPSGREAFRKDLEEVNYYGIHRFPALVIKDRSSHARLITGYREFETVEEIIRDLLIS